MNRRNFLRTAAAAIIIFGLAAACIFSFQQCLSKPDLGGNVIIFDPSMPMSTIQVRIDEIFNQQEKNEFGDQRYAVLFKLGEYDLDVRVGYYMQILGLGRLPDDVVINGAVRSNTFRDTRSVLTNFWRSMENLAVVPTVNKSNVWAVSQAAPLRRVHIKGDLQVHDDGYASGGFLADSKIDGEIQPGQQQQWLTRNSEMSKWGSTEGSWNFVFVGVNNTPSGIWPEHPYTVIKQTPIVREKPFLEIDSNDNYSVFVPALKYNSQGHSWANGRADGKSVPIDEFYIAHAGVDNSSSINAALETGKHLLLTPGIYHLDGPVLITNPNTIVLGIGLPSLVPENGTPALVCNDEDGIIIAGVVFDAAVKESPVLLQIGKEGSSDDHSQNPIFLFDIFCRVGTASVGNTKRCVVINSNNVVGDHFWLWRADHGPSALDGRPGWDYNKCANGLIVNGDDVTIYGLFNEHFQEYQTLWNGNGGRLFMYQSESPYDPPRQDAWTHDGVNGYASYKVNNNVTTHEAYGLGVYYVLFASKTVKCHNGYETPKGSGIKMNNLLTLRLVGREITHVINGVGKAAKEDDRFQRMLNYP